MEIDKDCEPYLQSNKVIQILQQQNVLLHNKVFDCLRRYKYHFYNLVPLQHYSIPNDILLMCAEDAFVSTEQAFFQNVKENKFQPVTENCLGYVRIIFKRNYLDLYKKEAERKMISKNYSGNITAKSFNDGERKLEKEDFLAIKVQFVINELSDEDKRIYNLRYKDNLQVKEIAALTGLQPKVVSNKLLRFHERFSKAWAYQNKNN